jgi:hypothetical protein
MADGASVAYFALVNDLLSKKTKTATRRVAKKRKVTKKPKKKKKTKRQVKRRKMLQAHYLDESRVGFIGPHTQSYVDTTG